MTSPLSASQGPFAISPSAWLCGWISVLTTLVVILCAVYLPLWSAVITITVCTGVAMQCWRREVLLASPDSIVALRFGQSRFDFQFKNGQWNAACWSPQSGALASGFVSSWLSIIAVRATDTCPRRYIVLMPDSLDHNASRRTRVWLKWSRDKDSDTVDN